MQIYGEYAGRTPERGTQRIELLKQWQAGESFLNRWNITAPTASVNAVLARNYPAYSTSIPDVVRARIFLAEGPLRQQDLARFEEVLAAACATGPLTEEHNYWLDRRNHANVGMATRTFGRSGARQHRSPRASVSRAREECPVRQTR